MIESEPLDDDPAALDMEPHPEGGWYRETWQHDVTVQTPGGTRPLASSVAFLLRPGERSMWHRVTAPELWLWQGGGRIRVTVGGVGDRPVTDRATELGAGGQFLVRAGEWQTAEPADGRAVLVACIVSPGFSFDDLTLAGD